jgi:pectate lyase
VKPLSYALAISVLFSLGVAEAQDDGILESNITITDNDGLPAFPGAEGFGAPTAGGRGGVVLRVTTLNPTGAGSLGAAIETTGKRIVVFRVSGVIDCGGDPFEVNYARREISVLAQTSPLGITLKNCSITNTITSESGGWPNVFQQGIFQFLTFDRNDGGNTFQFGYCHDVILDHVTLRGAADEVLDYSRCRDVTTQWSICSHSDTNGQQNCMLSAYKPNDEITFAKNLSAHHEERCFGQWHWDSGDANPTPPIRIEITNNVCYNAKFQQVGRMDTAGYTGFDFTIAQINLIGNTAIVGPNTPANPILFHSDGNPLLYNSDNHYPPQEIIIGPFATVNQVGTRHVFPNPVTVTSAAQAYEDVLNYSGSIPRDACTETLVDEVRNQNGAAGICAQALNTAAGTPWPDSDSDGCDDTWEAANGLSAASAADCAALHASGYANVERWAHDRRAALRSSLAQTVLGQKATMLGANQSILVSSVAETLENGVEMFVWGSTACYDPILKKIRYIGKVHSTFAYHTLEYDEQTDTWSRDGAWDVPAAMATPQGGHGFDHNACDPDTGDHYIRHGDNVYRWSGSWSSALAAESDMFPNVADGMCYITGTGVVWTTTDFFRYWNGIDWIALNGDDSDITDYHSICEYNRTSGVALIGAGNGGAGIRKWNGSALTSISTPDINCGASSSQGVLTTVPDDDKFICKQKATTAWRVYDVSANTWSNLTQSSGSGATPQSGTPDFDNNSGAEICGAVYLATATKIIACIEHDSTTNLVKLWLYKAN